jgi:hypothetical protein
MSSIFLIENNFVKTMESVKFLNNFSSGFSNVSPQYNHVFTENIISRVVDQLGVRYITLRRALYNYHKPLRSNHQFLYLYEQGGFHIRCTLS